MIAPSDGAFPNSEDGRASRRENMRAVLGGLFIVGVLLAAASAGGSASANEGNRPVAWVREVGKAGLDAARAVAIDEGEIYGAGLVGGGLPGQDSAGGSGGFLQPDNNR